MRVNRFAFILAGCGVAFMACAWFGYILVDDYLLHPHIQKIEKAQPVPAGMAYVDLPPIVVALSRPNSTSGSIKMDISMEVKDQYSEKLEGYRSLITDRIIHYTETLDYHDLSRPKSVIWLRPELLNVVNEATQTIPVNDIIFRQFVVL